MKRKKSRHKKIWLLPALLTLIMAAASAAIFFTLPAEPEEAATGNFGSNSTGSEELIIGPPGSAHYHSTFLIFVSGEMRRLDNAKYFEASPYAHLHDYSFAEIHTHAENATFGFFLQTLGITLNGSCISFEANESYCSNSTHKLKFYVEGQLSSDYGSRPTKDWEHYLISYGSEGEEEIARQIKAVPDSLASPPPPEKQPETGVKIDEGFL